MTRKTHKTENTGAVRRVLNGLLSSLISMLAISLVAGVIVYMQDDPLAILDITSLVVLLTSAAISGYIISKKTQERRILTVVLSSLILCLLLFALGMLLSGGGVTSRVYFNYLCYMGVAILFAWLGSREPARKRRRR